MSTPVKSPPVADLTALQGEVDKEKSQSNDADFKVPPQKDFGVVPVPQHLRYDSTKPFHFGLLLNIVFGFISTFSEYFNLLSFFARLLNFDYKLPRISTIANRCSVSFLYMTSEMELRIISPAIDSVWCVVWRGLTVSVASILQTTSLVV